MHSPKISVIVPVYNVEKYLRRCVDSILAQTFSDFELLLVDDGSPDNSGAICDHYVKHDSRIRVIHKSNAGVSSARNIGLDLARGEWIIFVDSDDMIEKAYLQSAINSSKPNDEIIFLPFIECAISAQGEIGKCRLNISYANTESEATLSTALTSTYIKTVWAKLYSKAAIKNIRFDESLRFGEDTLFVLKVLKNVSNLRFSRTDTFSRYLFDVNDEVVWYEKYTMSVKQAVKALTMIMEEYQTLNVRKMNFEIFITYVFRNVCNRDMQANWKDWYHNKTIKEISLSKARAIGWIQYIKTKLIFTPYGYPFFKLFGYK